jgi:hypothetical protein
VAFLDRREPLAAIVTSMEDELRTTLSRMSGLTG